MSVECLSANIQRDRKDMRNSSSSRNDVNIAIATMQKILVFMYVRMVVADFQTMPSLSPQESYNREILHKLYTGVTPHSPSIAHHELLRRLQSNYSVRHASKPSSSVLDVATTPHESVPMFTPDIRPLDPYANIRAFVSNIQNSHTSNIRPLSSYLQNAKPSHTNIQNLRIVNPSTSNAGSLHSNTAMQLTQNLKVPSSLLGQRNMQVSKEPNTSFRKAAGMVAPQPLATRTRPPSPSVRTPARRPPEKTTFHYAEGVREEPKIHTYTLQHKGMGVDTFSTLPVEHQTTQSQEEDVNTIPLKPVDYSKDITRFYRHTADSQRPSVEPLAESAATLPRKFLVQSPLSRTAERHTPLDLGAASSAMETVKTPEATMKTMGIRKATTSSSTSEVIPNMVHRTPISTMHGSHFAPTSEDPVLNVQQTFSSKDVNSRLHGTPQSPQKPVSFVRKTPSKPMVHEAHPILTQAIPQPVLSPKPHDPAPPVSHSVIPTSPDSSEPPMKNDPPEPQDELGEESHHSLPQEKLPDGFQRNLHSILNSAFLPIGLSETTQLSPNPNPAGSLSSELPASHKGVLWNATAKRNPDATASIPLRGNIFNVHGHVFPLSGNIFHVMESHHPGESLSSGNVPDSPSSPNPVETGLSSELDSFTNHRDEPAPSFGDPVSSTDMAIHSGDGAVEEDYPGEVMRMSDQSNAPPVGLFSDSVASNLPVSASAHSFMPSQGVKAMPPSPTPFSVPTHPLPPSPTYAHTLVPVSESVSVPLHAPSAIATVSAHAPSPIAAPAPAFALSPSPASQAVVTPAALEGYNASPASSVIPSTYQAMRTVMMGNSPMLMEMPAAQQSTKGHFEGPTVPTGVPQELAHHHRVVLPDVDESFSKHRHTSLGWGDGSHLTVNHRGSSDALPPLHLPQGIHSGQLPLSLQAHPSGSATTHHLASTSEALREAESYQARAAAKASFAREVLSLAESAAAEALKAENEAIRAQSAFVEALRKHG